MFFLLFFVPMDVDIDHPVSLVALRRENTQYFTQEIFPAIRLSLFSSHCIPSIPPKTIKDGQNVLQPDTRQYQCFEDGKTC